MLVGLSKNEMIRWCYPVLASIVQNSQISDSILSPLPGRRPFILHEDIFISKEWLARDLHVFQHPYMTRRPLHLAYEVLPASKLLDVTNDAERLSYPCLIFNLQSQVVASVLFSCKMRI